MPWNTQITQKLCNASSMSTSDAVKGTQENPKNLGHFAGLVGDALGSRGTTSRINLPDLDKRIGPVKPGI
jgi:hypothetical protein